MSTGLVTVDIEVSLADGVDRMPRNEVGSIVVIAEDTTRGLVTESDVLATALETDRPTDQPQPQR